MLAPIIPLIGSLTGVLGCAAGIAAGIAKPIMDAKKNAADLANKNSIIRLWKKHLKKGRVSI